jgi:hypothetical protein
VPNLVRPVRLAIVASLQSGPRNCLLVDGQIVLKDLMLLTVGAEPIRWVENCLAMNHYAQGQLVLQSVQTQTLHPHPKPFASTECLRVITLHPHAFCRASRAA